VDLQHIFLQSHLVLLLRLIKELHLVRVLVADNCKLECLVQQGQMSDLVVSAIDRLVLVPVKHLEGRGLQDIEGASVVTPNDPNSGFILVKH